MGLFLSNCLKGIHDEFPLTTPYRKTSRQSQLQSLLSNKTNPDVDGRKHAAPPPLQDQGTWGRPSTPQGGVDDSPGPPTPSSGSSHYGSPFSQTNSGSQQHQSHQQGTTTGPPNYNKERPRKVSFNFQSGKSDKEKNYLS